MRALARAVVVLATVATPLVGHAQDRREGQSAVVFARGRSLWQTPLRGDASPTEIAALGRPAAQIERISATADGATIMAETADAVLVARPRSGEVVEARRLPCAPPADLSLGGDAVLCRRDGAAVRVGLDTPMVHVLRDVGGTPAGFYGPSSKTLVVAEDDAICIRSLMSGRRRCLAPHSPPSREVHVAPSGERAVATYRRGDRVRLVTFRLDGRGVRRALMSGATAVAWSKDSQWLAVQRGRRACLVRAVGGQYKCWRGYRAVALSPDGQRILLARGDRPRALHVAPLAGARPGRPRKLIDAAGTGAAAWITPGPQVAR